MGIFLKRKIFLINFLELIIEDSDTLIGTDSTINNKNNNKPHLCSLWSFCFYSCLYFKCSNMKNLCLAYKDRVLINTCRRQVELMLHFLWVRNTSKIASENRWIFKIKSRIYTIVSCKRNVNMNIERGSTIGKKIQWEVINAKSIEGFKIFLGIFIGIN